jgi:molecular chaperone GrpE
MMAKKKKDVQPEETIEKEVDGETKTQEDAIDEESVAEEQAPELTKEEALTQEVEALKIEVAKLKTDVLKEHAELENTKKRLEKQHIIDRKYAAFGVAKALIEPLDNFDLALSHMPKDEANKQFVQGFKMINQQLHKALETEGVSEIDALGEVFDPNYHQAVMKEAQEDVDPNTVIEVFQKGYMFKDRVIRPAMVKISE